MLLLLCISQSFYKAVNEKPVSNYIGADKALKILPRHPTYIERNTTDMKEV